MTQLEQGKPGACSGIHIGRTTLDFRESATDLKVDTKSLTLRHFPIPALPVTVGVIFLRETFIVHMPAFEGIVVDHD